MHTTNASSGAGGLPRHTCSWLSMGAHGDRRRVALARYGRACLWSLLLRRLKQGKDQTSLVQHAEQYSETRVSKEAEHGIPSLGFLEPRSLVPWRCHEAVPLPLQGRKPFCHKQDYTQCTYGMSVVRETESLYLGTKAGGHMTQNGTEFILFIF